MRFHNLTGLTAALALVGMGCASAPMPQARLTASQAALRAAETVGADKVPPAALHLQLAREQIEKAEALVKVGDNCGADRLLQRAEADAELAVALAQEAPLRDQAQQALDKLEEFKRKSP